MALIHRRGRLAGGEFLWGFGPFLLVPRVGPILFLGILRGVLVVLGRRTRGVNFVTAGGGATEEDWSDWVLFLLRLFLKVVTISERLRLRRGRRMGPLDVGFVMLVGSVAGSNVFGVTACASASFFDWARIAFFVRHCTKFLRVFVVNVFKPVELSDPFSLPSSSEPLLSLGSGFSGIGALGIFTEP